MFKLSPGRTKFRVFGMAALDSSTEDFRNRIIINGSSISDRTLGIVDQLVVGLKADGIWNLLADVGIFTGANLVSALTKLKYPAGAQSNLTNYRFVSSDYSESLGLNPGANNNSKYLNTGLTEPSFAPSNTHLAIYTPSFNSNGGISQRDIGNATNDRFQLIVGLTTANPTTYYRAVGGFSNGNISATAPSVTGFFIGCQSSATSLALYRNGVSYSTATVAAGSADADPGQLTVFKASGQCSSRVISFYSIGYALNSSQVASYYQRVQGFQAALGRSV